MKLKIINIIFIVAAVSLTFFIAIISSYFQTGLALDLGEPSPMHITAPSDVINQIATERNRREAVALADGINPETAALIDRSLNDITFQNITNFFEELTEIRADYLAWQTEQSVLGAAALENWTRAWEEWQTRLAEWNAAVEAEENVGPEPVFPFEAFSFEPLPFPLEERFSFPILANEQREFLLSLTALEQSTLQTALYSISEELLREPGIYQLTETLYLSIQENLNAIFNDERYTAIGFIILADSIIPNRVFNEALFNRLWEATAEDYETVVLVAGQTIIAAGDLATEEILAILDALGMRETEWTQDIVPLIGVFILITSALTIALYYIYTFRRKAFRRIQDSALLFVLYAGMLALHYFMSDVSYVFLPMLFFPIIISMLIDSRAAVVLNLNLILVLFFLGAPDLEFLIFFIVTGTISSFLSRLTVARSKIFLVGLLVALTCFVISLGASFIFGQYAVTSAWGEAFARGGTAAANGALILTIAVGSLPLWEAVFGVVTPIKLLDLTNPTNPLLRRLTMEAPGTYHHSLIVANLAETAAYDIGANSHIARVGGYYHDVGKLLYPHYFAENLVGANPHDSLEPEKSAEIIAGHVSHGVVLANQYKLPLFVKDIIQEHHGNSVMRFFYHKALEIEKAKGTPDPEAVVPKEIFCYPNQNPQTRESAAIMLADGVEAAARAIMAKGQDTDEIEKLINSMIKGRLADGSLSDSGLSIKDVDIICKAFYRLLKGMYHERVPYPNPK